MRVSSTLPFVAFCASFVSGFSRQVGLTTIPLRPGFLQQRQNQQLPQTTPSSAAPFPTIVVTRGSSGEQSTIPRGGAKSSIDTGPKYPATGFAAVFSSFWGTSGVLYILAKAIKRVLPIALEPFKAGAVPLSQFELGAYIVTCLWFAYVEGYKGFQQKFSPLVVKRSFTLIPGQNGTKWWHFLIAPFYSMGLVHATKKRTIISWSVTIGVTLIVAAVKRLPYPWRNIVDAGVVAGLTWGSLSILLFYLKSWITGVVPAIDAALPATVNNKPAESAP
mmetsp:Transcript_20664/g.26664  ORF Transcript_20664/g.26664 Transcript_20664/m.26664 type:complete len:276 (-) Transcript_20664:43-870(-)|eukprot:CAMPEP_0198143118 /NCGR_PEP_ID=MMETSP1443-20131203/5811_1 /TAXON_ID=186043 /ORGANISM="Entomoneis sp., Strain CCMP2396" /LENGTH=275 /DNA_ID=CAMNT_0043806269 /DNA_START=141 /DNA_END=968 /DNA_ORIENTATION=+